MSSESDFAISYYLIKLKPSAHEETLKCIAVWSRNKTSDWLSSETESERKGSMGLTRSCSGDKARELLLKQNIEK